MSGSLPPLGYGLTGVLSANAASVSQHVANLTEQVSSGLVSQDYAGLGAAARTALDLQPQIATQQTLQTDVQAATGRLGVAQSALTQISSVVSGITSQLGGVATLSPSGVATLAASARSALQQVAGLLDTTDGGVYVFAGQDSANPPIPQPDAILSSGFYTQISSAVAGLSANGAAATSAATLAVAGSTAPGTSPFSASLEALAAAGGGRASIPTGQGVSVPGVMLANQNGDVQSTGTGTTGSYFRDILGGLASLAALTPASASASGLQAFAQSVSSTLTSASDTMNADAGVLGNRQTALSDTATAIGDTTTALQSQLSGIEDADLAQVSTQLSLSQTQLQASYQMIASLRSLSLANYL
ncbi:MAG TPA: flagellin [Acidisphaera sp.]|nr:flagellin [Acidisphaera sp.]HME20038.1 flagellin [Acetobacteraceae bacterium]